MRGKKYLLEKKEVGRPKEKLGKNCTISTKAKIAQETGVSPRTVINDAQIAEAVEDLALSASFERINTTYCGTGKE